MLFLFLVLSRLRGTYLFLDSLFVDFEVEDEDERELPFGLGDREVRLCFLFLPCLRLVDSTELEALRRSLCFFSFFSFLSLERSLFGLGNEVLPFGISNFPSYRRTSRTGRLASG